MVQKMGVSSIVLLVELIAAQLEAGKSAVAESNFRPEFDSPRFNHLAEKYQFDLVEVHCKTDLHVLSSRYQRRAESSRRHPVHIGYPGLLAELQMSNSKGEFDPLNCGNRLVTVDTTDFSVLDYQALFDAVLRPC